MTGIVSLLYVMENGDSAELAVVGREGLVGISLFMGGNSTLSRAVVQSAGKGLRLPARFLKEAFDRCAPGVGRGGVTEAAQKLQAAGLIRYRRGHITVLDRPGLERRTCECYAVVKKEYDRLTAGLTAG